jgi:hypothetical protein
MDTSAHDGAAVLVEAGRPQSRRLEEVEARAAEAGRPPAELREGVLEE